MTTTILLGSCLALLPSLPAGSAHACVTSPPYWGLRDYGAPGQLGLEPTPEEYVAALVNVFREVRRVLRDDGTLWLVLGDSYAGSWGNQGRKPGRGTQRAVNGPMLQRFDGYGRLGDRHRTGSWVNDHPVLKPKDLVGIPWRVAFALQADGWYLRSDVVWAKPNPMPESVRDRPTRSHEYVFLFSKSERYHYDAAAVREPAVSAHGSGNGFRREARLTYTDAAGPRGSDTPWEPRAERNRRTVWTVPTRPFPGGHFATFPEALAEPCVLAGCPEGGTVLDPFFGAGTTALVAARHKRHCVGIELNPAYADLARARLAASGGVASIRTPRAACCTPTDGWKYAVRLAPDERSRLERLLATRRTPARVKVRARVLLRADSGPEGPGVADRAVARRVGCGERTVARVRRRYAERGLAAALHGPRPARRGCRKLGPDAEAALTALARSEPPGGRGRWTVRLLAARLVELGVVAAIDPVTVWRALRRRA
jgi:DNA modification methylase/transposase